MKIGIQSLAIGIFISIGSFVVSYGASAMKLTELSHILYWQGWWLQEFIPCLNIGSAESPICEGTSLNIIVFFLGIPFGIILYALLAFTVLSVWRRRGI